MLIPTGGLGVGQSIADDYCNSPYVLNLNLGPSSGVNTTILANSSTVYTIQFNNDVAVGMPIGHVGIGFCSPNIEFLDSNNNPITSLSITNFNPSLPVLFAKNQFTCNVTIFNNSNSSVTWINDEPIIKLISLKADFFDFPRE